MKKTYLIPGPVMAPKEVLAAYNQNYGSSDLDPEFLKLYAQTVKLWQRILYTKNDFVMMTGEGMLGLWGALKSCLKPRDKVLAIDNGIFGAGIAAMAKTIGATVEVVKFPYNEAVIDVGCIEAVIKKFSPKMITVVHCETPSGILNSIAAIGELKKKYKIPLLCVDAVSSIGGTPVKVDEWNIDICLGGSQKAPSALADMTFLTVSPTAWDIIEKINYIGYDALLPFKNVLKTAYFPYTPHWHGVAALNVAAKLILEEGLTNVFKRHQKVAKFCRNEIVKLGLELFPAEQRFSSPTVTAIKVPEQISWSVLDKKLRANNLFLGGSYGILKDKVFRIGHMGAQADVKLMERSIELVHRIWCRL